MTFSFYESDETEKTAWYSAGGLCARRDTDKRHRSRADGGRTGSDGGIPYGGKRRSGGAAGGDAGGHVPERHKRQKVRRVHQRHHEVEQI